MAGDVSRIASATYAMFAASAKYPISDACLIAHGCGFHRRTRTTEGGNVLGFGPSARVAGCLAGMLSGVATQSVKI